MLLELNIRNFAVIKEVSISFGRGLTILTGETGAGKSILIDAISMLLGGRGSSEYVRYGCKKAEIEGLFEFEADAPVLGMLKEMGIDVEDNTLIIRRELASTGKTVCRVNGRLVTLSMLREVAPWLINIHGQHEHQSLMQGERHIDWLDAFGDERIAPAFREFSKLYAQYQQLRSELDYISTNEREMVQRMDMLRFQLQEIVSANLKPGEDEELMKEKKKLSGGEKLVYSLEDAYRSLIGEQRGIDWVGNAVSHLETILEYDEELRETHQMLESAFYQIEEAARLIRAYRDTIEFDPERLTQIESRLDEINRLKRKYGLSVDEILEYGASIEDELDSMENRETRIEELQKKLKEVALDLAVEAQELSQIRKQIAEKLAVAIEQELKDLHMSRAQFKIAVRQQEDERGLDVNGNRFRVTSKGIDTVEFLIAPNPGEPLRSVSKIASGGELSRIMLAMKTILADAESTDTMIFDEVDTGVSGRAAQAIAEKLMRVSRKRQVLSITHLPQVASMADTHLRIEKHMNEKETETKVNPLSYEERVVELARMLGGAQVTETTKDNAREMLAQAEEVKQELEG
ncbi:DNA repair protein RecN [Aneurinibacillus thermoaerophilus]|uniref:DNA repair protein RecN n=1 Tax=Aneurinibacillus thermoaerophilus TaxID=143495 RepID=UPI002E1A830D|nr:DNA repair protein RecN [Aneurinibacillus thermoaerophilus]MED0681305.1 DNA repair protein RecN [Aneurinibacillus thermoaerophilus]MED0764286.1 DNA repair protein RecN [Aneurinibacillus thermoaerophilus]